MAQDPHQEKVLDELSSRYAKNQIYTELGSVTVSLNPFKLLPIYSTGVVHSYGASPDSLPTHIFGFADKVYSSMVGEKNNQLILISGESGSGKTEAMKLILQYLIQAKSKELIQRRSKIDSGPTEDSDSQALDNILQAMILLQYFSHPQTRHHSNASQCWSWVELFFDAKAAHTGARIHAALLDANRVTNANFEANEKNFHIFYLLCEHRMHPRLVGLGLLPASEYRYLSGSEQKESGPNDFETVDALEMNLRAFRCLGVKDEELNVILRLLAGILLLGNINIVLEGEQVTISNPTQVDAAAKMLHIHSKKLHEALLRPTLKDSLLSRDTLAQDIYHGLFSELISLVNRGLMEMDCDNDPQQNYLSLSVLDVCPGSSDEDGKTLESLLTHYGNAQLMLHFYQQVFLNEKKAYEQDDVKISHLTFPSSQPTQDTLAQLERDINFLISQDSNTSVHPLLRDILTNNLYGRSPDKIAQLWKGKSHPRAGLSDMLARVETTRPHFLRCIRPNRGMKPDAFDRTSVQQQLELGAAFHAARLKTEGYPFRALKPPFLHRFQYCIPRARRKDLLVGSPLLVEQLIDALEIVARDQNLAAFSKDEIQVGKTNVFWTLAQQEVLDVLLAPERLAACIKLQALFRGCLVRKGNANRKQTYQRAYALIQTIKSYSAVDPEFLKKELLELSASEVKLPIMERVRQWKLWITHYHQVVADLKTVLQYPDSLAAVEGVFGRVELESFLLAAPESKLPSSPATTSHLLLRHTPSVVNVAELRQKEFQDFVRNSPVVSNLVNQLVAQRTRLTACNTATVALKDALLTDNGEAISQALKLAEAAQLESPLVQEARALLARLGDEQNVVGELTKAMNGTDLAALEKALDDAKRIALDDERSTLIHSAIDRLHKLYREQMQKLPDADKAALATRAQAYGFPEDASPVEKKKPPPPPPSPGSLPRAESAGFVGSIDKKQHSRVGSGNSFELNSPLTLAQQTELDQAITNRDLEALHKLLGGISPSDVTSERSRQIRRADALIKQLEQEKKMESALEAAIEELDQDALRGILKEAALCGMPVSELMRTARNICYEITAHELLQMKIENALSQVKDDLSNVDDIKAKVIVFVKQLEEMDMKNDAWARRARLFLRSGTPHARVSFKLHVTDKAMLGDMKARRSFSLLPDTSQFADVMNTPRNHHPLSKYSGLRDPATFTRLSIFKQPKNMLESMCRYQKKNLSSSLTQMSKDKSKICKEIFQNILGYMKITYHPYPVTLGHAVIMAGLNNVDLRDEIYAQLIKQTTFKIPKLGPGARKPSVKQGMIHGWVLLYFTINTFLPSSEEMKPILLDHIVAATHLPTGGEFDPVVQYAMHCYAAYKVMIGQPDTYRPVPPSIDQMRLASDGELDFTQIEMTVLELVDKDRTDLEKPVRNKVKAAKIRQYNKEYFSDTVTPTDFEERMESPCMTPRGIRQRRNTGGSSLLSPSLVTGSVSSTSSSSGGDGDGSPTRGSTASSGSRGSLVLPASVGRALSTPAPSSPNQRHMSLSNVPPPPPSPLLLSSPNQRNSSLSNAPPPPDLPALVE